MLSFFLLVTAGRMDGEGVTRDVLSQPTVTSRRKEKKRRDGWQETEIFSGSSLVTIGGYEKDGDDPG